MNRLDLESIRLEMAGIFLAWAGAYAWLLISGRYQIFLRPGFWALLLWALGILLAFLIAMLVRMSLAGHVTYGAIVWIRLGVLLLPLFYLLAAQDKPLGSHAFKSRSMAPRFPAAITSANAPQVLPKDGKLTILQVLRNFEHFKGKRVITEGMVYRDEKMPGDHFLVFRFLIVCCAADALPAGALVAHGEAGSFEKDSWVQVEGILGLKQVEGRDFPCIEADKITTIDPLKNPYLYPRLY